MKRTFKATKYACYAGIFTQAIINNLSPVFFVIYQSEFNISVRLLSVIILVNFLTQLCVDIFSIKMVDKIGHRVAMCISNAFTVIGLVLLSILPGLINPFVGVIIPTIIYAISSGLVEVLVSPIIESIPGDEKVSAMSMLHSFYCWGQVCVVLISTLLLKIFGTENWIYIPLIWAVIPFVNFFNFITVPLVPPISDEERIPLRSLFAKNLSFILFLILMFSAGACELSMSQWASLFAEKSLGVSKVWGDIFGPCMFAVLMGCGRLFYGIWGEKIDLRKALIFCAFLCTASYLITSLVQASAISLFGCMLCGLSVGLMWPGTFSMSAKSIKNGGTAMFALLAVAGDLGCASGPFLSGILSSLADNSVLITMDGMKFGILISATFPLTMLLTILLNKKLK